jgi:hypothetical protein
MYVRDCPCTQPGLAERRQDGLQGTADETRHRDLFFSRADNHLDFAVERQFFIRCRGLCDDLAFFVPSVQFDPAPDQDELLVLQLCAGAVKGFSRKIRDRGHLAAFGHLEGNYGGQKEDIEEKQGN